MTDNNKTTLSMIAAMANNRAIGRENGLPWYIPEDFKHFKTVTTGKPIIMGRKTFVSIGRPLPNRTNIIITSNKNLEIDNVITTSSLTDAIEFAKTLDNIDNRDNEVMIIGGASVYEQALPLVDKLYLTHIDMDIPDADAFFPEYKPSEWHVSETRQPTDTTPDLPPYYFETLVRK